MPRLAALLAAYLLLVTLYSLNTPYFEAPDAYYHFGMIEYISREAALPPDDDPLAHPWEQMVFHAPLYYLISGVLIAPIDTSDFPEQYPHNPHARIGLPDAAHNKNFAAPGEVRWNQTPLAVFLVRGFSMILGGVTLVSVYTMGRLLFPNRVGIALLAALFVMLNPQFLYLSAMINNDNLALALSMVTLALLVFLFKRGMTWRRVMALGVVMALASLSKVSTLPLYPTVGLGLLWLCYRAAAGWGRFALWLKMMFVLGLLWAVIAGWWYVRNIALYGEPFATDIHAEVFGRRADDPTSDEFGGMFLSFWAVFGWFNITVPDIFYDWVTLILVLGVGGVLVGLWKQQPDTESRVIIGLFAFHAAAVFISWYRFNQMVSASQGRIVFGILGGLALMMAYGLRNLPRVPLSILLGGMAAGAVGFPALAIAPTFTPSPVVDSLPADVHPVAVRYGPIHLLGYRAYREDESLMLKLYWRSETRTEKPLSLYIQVYAPDEEGNPVEAGKIDTYPSGGLRRTDTWETGVIYEDTYRLETEGEFGPYEPRFKIGWRDNGTGEEILPTTVDGTPLESVIVRGGSVRASQCSPPTVSMEARFGDLAQLKGYRLPANLTVQPGGLFDLQLQWQVLAETPENFTVFVQLVNPDDLTHIVGSGDSVPRQDWYPTSAWLQGVCFDDTYRVQLRPDAPPGEYHLLVGFYRPENGTRLPTHPGTDAVQLETPVQIEQ